MYYIFICKQHTCINISFMYIIWNFIIIVAVWSLNGNSRLWPFIESWHISPSSSVTILACLLILEIPFLEKCREGLLVLPCEVSLVKVSSFSALVMYIDMYGIHFYFRYNAFSEWKDSHFCWVLKSLIHYLH